MVRVLVKEIVKTNMVGLVFNVSSLKHEVGFGPCPFEWSKYLASPLPLIAVTVGTRENKEIGCFFPK